MSKAIYTPPSGGDGGGAFPSPHRYNQSGELYVRCGKSGVLLPKLSLGFWFKTFWVQVVFEPRPGNQRPGRHSGRILRRQVGAGSARRAGQADDSEEGVKD